jgi:hypothetical protein
MLKMIATTNYNPTNTKQFRVAGTSPIHSWGTCQLAKVRLTFANIWRNSTTFLIIKTGDIDI